MFNVYDHYAELVELSQQRELTEDEYVDMITCEGTIQALETERDYLNGECSIGGYYYEED